MSALRLLKKSRSKRYDVCSDVVRERRLELPRRLSHAPQTCLSTCSSTLADRFRALIIAIFVNFVNRKFRDPVSAPFCI